MLGKSDISNETKQNTRQLLDKCAWLPGCVHIEERLNEGPRVQWKWTEQEKEKPNARERQSDGWMLYRCFDIFFKTKVFSFVTSYTYPDKTRSSHTWSQRTSAVARRPRPRSFAPKSANAAMALSPLLYSSGAVVGPAPIGVYQYSHE